MGEQSHNMIDAKVQSNWILIATNGQTEIACNRNCTEVMMYQTDDGSKKLKELLPPIALLERYPATETATQNGI